MKMIHGDFTTDFFTTSTKQSYACEVCDQTFSFKSSLRRHEKVKHFKANVNYDFIEDMDKIIELSCDQCDQTFNRRSNLARHISVVHEKDKTSKKGFVCTFCEKYFSRKDALSRHINSNHEQ